MKCPECGFTREHVLVTGAKNLAKAIRHPFSYKRGDTIQKLRVWNEECLEEIHKDKARIKELENDNELNCAANRDLMKELERIRQELKAARGGLKDGGLVVKPTILGSGHDPKELVIPLPDPDKIVGIVDPIGSPQNLEPGDVTHVNCCICNKMAVKTLKISKNLNTWNVCDECAAKAPELQAGGIVSDETAKKLEGD